MSRLFIHCLDDDPPEKRKPDMLKVVAYVGRPQPGRIIRRDPQDERSIWADQEPKKSKR